MASVVMLLASVIAAHPLSAQTTIRLYTGVAPGSESWSLPAETITTLVPGVTGVANVSEPTLTVFRPNPGTANGTAVIVAPGGGFHFLTVDEDTKAAEWLAARGVTAFLLKYRISQTTKQHRETMFKESVKQQTAEQGAVFPLAVADAKRALSHIRGRAAEWRVTLRSEPKVARLLLRRLVSPLVLLDESTRPDFIRADCEAKTGLMDGLAEIQHVASPNGIEYFYTLVGTALKAA